MKFWLGIGTLGMLVCTGCGNRSAEDRVLYDPLRPAVTGYDPGYVTVAQRPAPKYRLSGNKIMVSRGTQSVYVLPYTNMPLDDADRFISIQDDRVMTHLDEIERHLDEQIRKEKEAKEPAKDNPVGTAAPIVTPAPLNVEKP